MRDGLTKEDVLGQDESFLIAPPGPSDCGDSADRCIRTSLLGKISWSRVELNSEILWIGRDEVDQTVVQTERDAALQKVAELEHQIAEQNRLFEIERDGSVHSTDILGSSDAIRYVLHKIGQVASTTATVLIEGETGVGKELVARTIHENSLRRDRPLVRVNCAALPPTLIESELFGHEKGSFTGADRIRQGLFEMAEGGTLFLDEIGELGLDLQSKLLRVLQDGEYTRVGGTRTIRSDVRVIAATNIDLANAVEHGRFRKDLYYRLHVFPITVPALRERPEDIPILTQHFVQTLCQRYGRPVLEIRMSVINRLTAHNWPGNVRELHNVVERAVIGSAGTVLTLPIQLSEAGARVSQSPPAACVSLAEMERRYIKEVLTRVNGQIAGHGGAAEILELHPNTLRGRMAKLRIARLDPAPREGSRRRADHEKGEPEWTLGPQLGRQASAGD